MKTIKVKVTHKGIRYILKVLDGCTVDELEREIKEKQKISDDYYMTRTRRIGGEPPDFDVHDGDEFIFKRIDDDCHTAYVTLYGCPTANDIPGELPSCMLTTFDGLVIKNI